MTVIPLWLAKPNRSVSTAPKQALTERERGMLMAIQEATAFALNELGFSYQKGLC